MDVKLAVRVILADPADCERVCRIHLMKEPTFHPVVYDSIISTMDTEHWRKQRGHLAAALVS